MRSTCQRNLYYNTILHCSVAYRTMGFFYLLKSRIGTTTKVKWTLNNGLHFFLTKLSLLNLRRWNYGNLLNSVLSLFVGGKILISSVSMSCLLFEERHFDKEPPFCHLLHTIGREGVFFRKDGVMCIDLSCLRHVWESHSGMATKDGPLFH